MADDGKVELQGEVIEAFRGGMYRIALDNDHETLGYVSGKMRRPGTSSNRYVRRRSTFGTPWTSKSSACTTSSTPTSLRRSSPAR